MNEHGVRALLHSIFTYSTAEEAYKATETPRLHLVETENR